MSRNNETVERCFHCNQKYLAGCIKGQNTCPDCMQAGHRTVLNWECEVCKEELRKVEEKSA